MDKPGSGDAELTSLRARHYNAEVTGIERVHDDLIVLRTRPDWGEYQFIPGQYTVLGLGNWEPRIAGVQEDRPAAAQLRQVVRRAYSISFPMLDAAGQLLRPTAVGEVEFYIALVRRAAKRPPALTPRLFGLAVGDRLLLGERAHGSYTLAGVESDADVVFAATGTGEAPHNAMVAELLLRGHRGRIVSLSSVRHLRDLAYLRTHRRLEKMFANYRYIGLTTREPCNLDANRADYVGKCHLQEFFASGGFEQATGIELDPARQHIFLCGNPGMIGHPQDVDGVCADPRAVGMIEILEARGFRLDKPKQRGNIHTEKFW
jgi:ferredoxin--NADP+ reductase